MPTRNPPRGDEQRDLFVAIFTDIPIRDQRDMMERPFFSLAKNPRAKPIQYRDGETWVEVSANPQFGMATIWDADCSRTIGRLRLEIALHANGANAPGLRTSVRIICRPRTVTGSPISRDGNE